MTDAIDTLLTRVRMTAGHLAPVLLTPTEASALVAEVERLRAEVERRRDVYDLMGAVEHSANKLAAHEDMGALRERAAVVAFLRWGNDTLLYDAADAIENGEHRREKSS